MRMSGASTICSQFWIKLISYKKLICAQSLKNAFPIVATGARFRISCRKQALYPSYPESLCRFARIYYAGTISAIFAVKEVANRLPPGLVRLTLGLALVGIPAAFGCWLVGFRGAAL